MVGTKKPRLILISRKDVFIYLDNFLWITFHLLCAGRSEAGVHNYKQAPKIHWLKYDDETKMGKKQLNGGSDMV